MNLPPEQTPPDTAAIPTPPVTVPKRGWFPCGCWTWVLSAFLLFVLVGLLMPSMGGVQVKGSQTKALAQAKQISLALKLFAGDNNGNYPRQSIPAEMKEVPKSSNAAFACLFPTYTSSERIFGNKLSAYSSARGPDDTIDNPYTGHPVQTLRPGENVYGYVLGLTDADAPDTPIIADGTDGTGHYVKDAHARGGVWKGEKAVVIRLDGSGAVETLVGPDHARYIPRRQAPPPPGTRPGDAPVGTPRVPRDDAHAPNLLDVAGLGKDVRLLDPAVPPQ